MFYRLGGPRLPRGFLEDLRFIERSLARMSKFDVAGAYSGLQGVDVQYLGNGRFLVRDEVDEALSSNYIAPSMFVGYRACARRLAIELSKRAREGGMVVGAEGLRSLLRGLLAHRVYAEKYAQGETEYHVVSHSAGISGYIDEVRRGYWVEVLEVKTSRNIDPVGASLQVMAYVRAFSDQEGVDTKSVRGYVLTPAATYTVVYSWEVLEEYMKRLRAVIASAASGDPKAFPPRLPPELRGRCEACPLRRECYSVEPGYRSWEEFFEANGLKRLRPTVRATLDDYGQEEKRLEKERVVS